MRTSRLGGGAFVTALACCLAGWTSPAKTESGTNRRASDPVVRLTISGGSGFSLVSPRQARIDVVGDTEQRCDVPGASVQFDNVEDVTDTSDAVGHTQATIELERPESGIWRLQVRGPRGDAAAVSAGMERLHGHYTGETVLIGANGSRWWLLDVMACTSDQDSCSVTLTRDRNVVRKRPHNPR
jgi:hypothetical protein